MQCLTSITELRAWRQAMRQQQQTIAFVPTMGNLHQGHLDLVAAAKTKADQVIVSIFVNPMQFGAHEDLANYPRTLAADQAALEALGVSALFIPSVDDIYPRGLAQQTFVEVPGISDVICGASRPGHFRGVATIVNKLFNMVEPDCAFFGEKDYQQLQIIKAMVMDLSLPIEIYPVATRRETDGLAMSSRNHYLSPEERAQAPQIYQALQRIQTAIVAGERHYAQLLERETATLCALGFRPDYLEICDGFTLQPANQDTRHLVILVAAFLGTTRLIDNIQIQLTD